MVDTDRGPGMNSTPLLKDTLLTGRSAADATSHLFFAYLRSRTPDEIAGSSGISQLPRSLLALVGQTEYPPETPALLQTSTPKVVMVVEKVSPTPYALLRRSRHFNFPQNEPCLETFSDYEDPLKALTIECRRVLDCVASENQSGPNDQFPELTKPTDSSWSNFQDLGFSSFGDNNQPNGSATRGHGAGNGLRSAPASGRHDHGRPITPSWADFLSSGFADDATVRNPASLRVPSEQMLPPLHGQRVQSSQSHVRGGMRDDNLDEAELGHVSRINLDETFWWVWMTSLAGEETTERKSVFGRCAFVETDIRDAHWLLMEEKVKGAVETPEEGVYIAEKKSRFTFGRKGRNRTDSSTGKIPNVPKKDAFKASSTPALAHHQPNPSQEAKVQAAAAEIVRQKKEDDEAAANAQRRARMGPDSETRTNSVMSLGMQPVLREEAGPAMQWARKFDKETIRSRYLGDPLAGLGNSRAASPASSMDLISAAKAVPDYERQHYTERQLPPTPPPEASTATLTAREEPSQSDGPILSQPQPIRPGPAPKMLDAPETSKQHRYNQSEMTMVSPDIQNQHHTLRKDVGSIDSTRGDHPALRQSAEEQTHSIQTTPEKQRTVAPAPPSAALPAPPMAPAAAAAAAAMRNMNAARPPPPPSKTEPRVLHKSKTGSTRKFKNLFSRKKADDQEPEALAMHRAINGASQKRKPVNKAEPSPMPQRDQEVSSPPAYSSAPVDHQAMAGSPEPDLPAVDDGEPGPEIETAPTPRGHSSGGAMHEYEQDYNQYRQDDGHEIHRQTQHGNQSSANFSNFSQGPLEDQPAFVGVDDEESEHHLQHNAEPTLHEQQNREEVTPTNSKPAHFNTGAAQRLFGGMQPANTEPETPNENYATPMAERDLRGDGLSSEQERPESGAPAPSVPFADAGDRWAQIRRNAAERRTEEPSGTSRGNRVSLPSQSGKTERTDDGETSGEESRSI